MAKVGPDVLGAESDTAPLTQKSSGLGDFGALMGMNSKVVEGQFMEVTGVDEARAKDAYGEIRDIQESCKCGKQLAGTFACCCCICTLGLSCIPAILCNKLNAFKMGQWAEKYPLIAERCYRSPEILLMTGLQCPKPSDAAIARRKAQLESAPKQEEMK